MCGVRGKKEEKGPPLQVLFSFFFDDPLTSTRNPFLFFNSLFLSVFTNNNNMTLPPSLSSPSLLSLSLFPFPLFFVLYL